MGAAIYGRVGRRIQALRQAHALTQNELAEHADIAASYLVKLEGGARKARLEILERIAAALGEPLWRLFADDRLTVDEKRWVGEARRLAEVVRPLPEEDLQVLLALAQHIARLRGP